MNVRIEDAGPCRKIMHIKAPADVVAPGYEDVINDYASVAAVPGFRSGKAPKSVVEKRYAKRIAEDAKERLVPRLYREALEQEKIKPVAIIEVKDVVFDKAEGLGFTVTVDVPPEFKLPKYKRIVVHVQPVEVDEARVQEAFDGLLEQFSRFEPVTGRSVNIGDFLRVDFTSTCDGAPLKDLVPNDVTVAEATDFLVLAGEPEFLPGLGQGLEGAEVDETREIEITFPEAFRVADLSGKTGHYRVTVKAIQERVKPEMDEAFLGNFDVTSEAELKARVRDRLTEEATREEDGRRREQVAKHLLEKTRFELPQSVVEQETRSTIQNMVSEISRRGASQQQIQQQQDSIVSAATQTSTDRVRLSYILAQVASQEEIGVEDLEVDERIEAMAVPYRMTKEQLREEIEKRHGVEALRSEIQAEKTMTFLIENAKLKK